MQEFSTSTVGEPRRFEYWRELIAAQFVDLDCTRTARGSFYGSLASQPLGRDCNLLMVKSTSQSVVLSVDRCGTQDAYVLNYLIAGHGRAFQHGRVHEVFAGELFLFDLTSAAQLDLVDDFSLLTVSLPRREVDRDVAAAQHLCAVPIGTAQAGPGSVCKDMLQSLASNCQNFGEDQAQAVVEALVRVIASAYGSSPAVAAAATPASQSVILTRIRSYILAHLDADHLTPPQIARAHGISERHLSKLFESEETTLSRWIWLQRLEESRRMLAAPSFFERTIKEIAHACGFHDMSHFSCAFKSKFGSTPREYQTAQMLLRQGDSTPTVPH